MKKHPPLWVWISCASFIVFFLAYLQMNTSGRRQLLSLQQHQVFLNHLANFSTHYVNDTSQCKVVFWGSSITRQAIANSDMMHEQIADYGGNIDFQKMYMLGLNSQKFPYLYELFDITKQLKPEIICIEDNLFSYAKIDQPSLLNKELSYLIESWGLVNRPKSSLSEAPSNSFDSHDIRFDIPQQKDTTDISIAPRRVRTYADNKRLNEQLTFVRTQKIPLVIVNIPRASTVQDQFTSSTQKVAIERQISDYQTAGYQIEYWKFPNRLAFEHYRDYTHMNKTGRAIFSKWLSQRIAEKLANECH